jgi:hypothetical protein
VSPRLPTRIAALVTAPRIFDSAEGWVTPMTASERDLALAQLADAIATKPKEKP